MVVAAKEKGRRPDVMRIIIGVSWFTRTACCIIMLYKVNEEGQWVMKDVIKQEFQYFYMWGSLICYVYVCEWEDNEGRGGL